MASVAELKLALETEQSRAIEIADRALTAISTISAVSGVAIGFLALLIAILGFIGYNRIKSSANSMAAKVAAEAVSNYISTEDFEKLMERKVAEEAQKRWQNTVIVREFTAPERSQSEASPFPEREES